MGLGITLREPNAAGSKPQDTAALMPEGNERKPAKAG